jgi:thiol-disulfide isomerase/thioredoxin
MKRSLLILTWIAITEIEGFAQSPGKLQLTIGDAVPNIRLNDLVGFSENEISLAALKGKSVIVYFWAPWCVPCISSFPKLDSLQQQFQSKLFILPVTDVSRIYAGNTIKAIKRQKGLQSTFSVVEDTILSNIFRHRVIPHYVWINAAGKITAITGPSEVTANNIQRLINDEVMSLPVKKDERIYDGKKPFFVEKYNDLSIYRIFRGTQTEEQIGSTVRITLYLNCIR